MFDPVDASVNVIKILTLDDYESTREVIIAQNKLQEYLKNLHETAFKKGFNEALKSNEVIKNLTDENN